MASERKEKMEREYQIGGEPGGNKSLIHVSSANQVRRYGRRPPHGNLGQE